MIDAHEARAIATEAHANDNYLCKNDYLEEHVSRVVKNVLMIVTDNYKNYEKFEAHVVMDHAVVAWLHDVIEDHPEYKERIWYTLHYTPREALWAITKEDGEDYEDYIERLSYNDIARRVKIADLWVNLSNLEYCNDDRANRLRARYEPALKKLERIENAN